MIRSPVLIRKLSMFVFRRDGDSEAEHIAALFSLPSYHIVVDLTHLQYDLKKEIKRASWNQIKKEPRALEAAREFAWIFHEARAKELGSHDPGLYTVLKAWKDYIFGKPFIETARWPSLRDRAENVLAGATGGSGSPSILARGRSAAHAAEPE